jgi:hypothetical protein
MGDAAVAAIKPEQEDWVTRRERAVQPTDQAEQPSRRND